MAKTKAPRPIDTIVKKRISATRHLTVTHFTSSSSIDDFDSIFSAEDLITTVVLDMSAVTLNVRGIKSKEIKRTDCQNSTRVQCSSSEGSSSTILTCSNVAKLNRVRKR